MSAPAERMRTMRAKREARGLREVRIVLPDARAPQVRRRLETAVAGLPRAVEEEALAWIESVSEFDADR